MKKRKPSALALPSPSAEKTLKERHDPPRCGAELNQSRYPHQDRRVQTRSPYPQYQWYIMSTRTVTDVDRDSSKESEFVANLHNSKLSSAGPLQVASDTASSAPDLQAAMRYLGVSGRRAQDVCSQVFLSIVCAPL